MLLGVAAVAGAMYVAAAAGSQRSAQSAGPTAKQFAALKKQVAALQKKVKTVQNEADGEAAVLLHCVLAGLAPMDRRSGYSFGTGVTTALDIAANPITAGYQIPSFNEADPTCMNFVGIANLRHKDTVRSKTALQHYAAAFARKP
jgi:hypothetical protein